MSRSGASCRYGPEKNCGDTATGARSARPSADRRGPRAAARAPARVAVLAALRDDADFSRPLRLMKSR
jgi:hypothetical protein